MKVLVIVNFKELLNEYIEEVNLVEFIEMYYLFDDVCVEIEDELICMGVWEEDE